MVDVKTRKLIYDKLVSKGAEFRKGFGVSGRMANFLDNNPDRIGLAMSILMSLPGIPIIYYGDEIGAQNNWDYAKLSAKQREEFQNKKGNDLDVISYFDSRDINRGPITKETFYKSMTDSKTLSGQIHKKTKSLIKARKTSSVIRRGEFKKLSSKNKDTFSYLRTLKNDNVVVINNLSKENSMNEVILPENVLKSISKQDVLIDLISQKSIEFKIENNILKLNLQPYQSVWLEL